MKVDLGDRVIRVFSAWMGVWKDGCYGWTPVNDLWAFLTEDCAIVSGLHSPMLSWIGLAGILAICCWHSAVLLHRVWLIRRVLYRLEAQLVNLLSARRQGAKEWIILPTVAGKKRRLDEPQEARRDLDDLHVLDQTMRSEPAFAADWLSYRKTLAIEQPAWFLEPTVSAQKSAVEFFSFESCVGQYLNAGLYRQLPSFLTGMGLMFTFLAILIGLSKLHATESQVEGISGLINGLSGKFVTSIAGLACANLFTILETSVWYRLGNGHRRCLALLDEVFPQRIVDQHTQSQAVPSGQVSTIVSAPRNEGDKQLAEVMHQRLGPAIAALTKASESLTALSASRNSALAENLPGEIGHEVQQALKRAVQPLLDAIQGLDRTMKGQVLPVQLSKTEMETIFHELKTHEASSANTLYVKAGGIVNNASPHE